MIINRKPVGRFLLFSQVYFLLKKYLTVVKSFFLCDTNSLNVFGMKDLVVLSLKCAQ